MSTLKSYSCSKCGGILNVDRDQDILDCPFCGTRIDYIDFHSEDLLTQAEYCRFRKDYREAKEKYEEVLLNDPANFIALRGIAFCEGDIYSDKKLEDPVNLNRCFYNGILRVLDDDRYRNSLYAEYFSKLAEVINKAQEYNKFSREKKSLYLTSIRGDRFKLDDSIDKAQHGINVSGEEYAKLYSELKALEPDVNSESMEKTRLGFGSVTPSYKLLRIGCEKCGGTLSLDKERKLYTCSHCGIAYGYSLFYGDPVQKAMAELMTGDFETADKRFVHILMFDPKNCEALRGRVLCAGKWKSFSQIRLSDDLMNVDWQLVMQRVDECQKRAVYPHETFYDLIEQLMKLLKEYSDTLIMIQIEPNNRKHQDRKEKLIKLYPPRLRRLMYIDRAHHFASWDHKNIVFTQERLKNAPEALKRGDFTEAEDCYRVLNLDDPKNPLILHQWILCAGRWSSFSQMKITDFRSRNNFSLLLGRIMEAQELSPDEYHGFYDKLFKLLELINQHFENSLLLKESKKEEDRICKAIRNCEVDVNDSQVVDKWNEANFKTEGYEKANKKLEMEFDDLLQEFVKMDRELFGEQI